MSDFPSKVKKIIKLESHFVFVDGGQNPPLMWPAASLPNGRPARQADAQRKVKLMW